MFYIWSMNAALGALLIDPTVIKQHTRQAAAITGKSNGNSPQESALALASMLPLELIARASPRAAVKWAKSGKINLERDEVLEALIVLGWYGEVSRSLP